jgi:hypothetical protein
LTALIVPALLCLPALAAGPAHDYRALEAARANEADAIDRWLAFETPYAPAFETRYAVDDWLARTQQQPNNPPSVPSRFDGVLHSHKLSSELQVHAFAGVPKDNPTPAYRTLYGLGVDLKAVPPRWHGSFYSMEQSIDGYVDRQAVGGALRYEEPTLSVRSQFDYDTSFDELNQARVQGTWKTRLAAWNFQADRHKTPTLQASTALTGETSTSIDNMLGSLSEDELRRRAKALTAVSTQTGVGFARPLYGKWNLGGEVKMAHTTATAGTDLLAGTPDTGNVYTYALQTNANNLLVARDGTRFEVSFIDAPTYFGQLYQHSYRAQLGPRWTLDTSLRWYDQTDIANVEFESVTPILRVGYAWKNNVTLGAEVGMEDSKTSGAGFSDAAQREFASLNYRRSF